MKARVVVLAVVLTACAGGSRPSGGTSPTTAPTTPPQTSPSPEKMTGEIGDTLISALGNESTVHSFTEAREVIASFAAPEDTFYEVDIEFCATGEIRKIAPYDIAYSLAVEDAESRQFSPDGTEYESDYLITNFRQLQPGECIRGRVGFEIPKSSKPVAVSEQVTDGVLRWEL